MEMPYAISSSYGSYCFEDNNIIVEMIHEDVPELRMETYERVGGDGSVLRSSNLGSRNITLDCRAFCETWRDFDLLKDEIASLLLLEGEQTLSLRNHFGEYYLAKLIGFEEDERQGGSGIGSFKLNFLAFDPIRFGAKQSAVVSGSGTTRMDVSGTYQTSIRVSATSAKRDSSTGMWGLRFDNGDYLHVKLGSDSQSTIAIDCYKRTVTVNGNPTVITLDSNWPVLKAGQHTVRMDYGTGSATVEWQERNV